VPAAFTGRVVEVSKKQGATVRKGDVLGYVDPENTDK